MLGKVVGVMFLLVIAVAVIGIVFVMAGSQSGKPFEDSYGGVQSNQSNTTQEYVISNTGTGISIGAAAVMVLGCMVVFFGVLLATRSTGRSYR